MKELNDINNVSKGTLIKDPELYYTKNGTAICLFSIAIENHETIDNISIQVLNKVADACYQYIKKGDSVEIVGRLKEYNWKDSKGNNKSKYTLIGREVSFLNKGL